MIHNGMLVPDGFKAYVPSANPIANCIGVRANGAGNLTFKDGNGVESTIALADKETFVCRITVISAFTGTGIFIYLGA